MALRDPLRLIVDRINVWFGCGGLQADPAGVFERLAQINDGE